MPITTTSVKRLIYELIHNPGMTLLEKADLLGVDNSTLSRWAKEEDDENSSSRPFPFVQAIPLMRLTGDHRLLRHAAHLLGYGLVKITDARTRISEDYFC